MNANKIYTLNFLTIHKCRRSDSGESTTIVIVCLEDFQTSSIHRHAFQCCWSNCSLVNQIKCSNLGPVPLLHWLLMFISDQVSPVLHLQLFMTLTHLLRHLITAVGRPDVRQQVSTDFLLTSPHIRSLTHYFTYFSTFHNLWPQHFGSFIVVFYAFCKWKSHF